MTLTDAVLLKYVDGHLSASEVLHIEKMLESDEVARENVRLMQASGEALRYRNIKEEELGAVTDLKARLLTGEMFGTSEVMDGKEQNAPISGSVEHQGMVTKSWWGFSKIAAGLVVMLGGLIVSYNLGVASLSAEDVQMSKLPVWVARVVDYHTLYDRETVSGSNANSELIAQLESNLGALLDRRLVVPDLSDSSLEFKRGQVLKLEGQEIIQLAYLPQGVGKPVALCLRTSEGADRGPQYYNLRGLEVAQWQQNGIEYLLLGDQNRAQSVARATSAMAQIGSG